MATEPGISQSDLHHAAMHIAAEFWINSGRALLAPAPVYVSRDLTVSVRGKPTVRRRSLIAITANAILKAAKGHEVLDSFFKELHEAGFLTNEVNKVKLLMVMRQECFSRDFMYEAAIYASGEYDATNDPGVSSE